MNFWTLDRLAQALADELDGARPEGRIALGRVVTDTRIVAPGDVFVALIGERFDGHDFCAEAVRRGAVALVVSDPRQVHGLGVPAFTVGDTTRALGALGSYRRRAWGGPVVAVAGSNGKTSTKELVAAALSSVLSVHATRGNLNNQVGVPLTLLAIPDDADIAVVELGTNHPGEVAALRAIVGPDIAVVTSIGEEHLEGFGDLEGVLREECSVFDGVALAITPSAQPEVAREARTRAGRVVEAGCDRGDVHPASWGVSADGHGWATLGALTLRVPLLGAHNVRNAMLAIAVARSCGVADADAVRGIESMPPLPMRSAREALGTMLLLNDAYNANPASAREALAMLDAIGGERPRVAVLGSMLELGPQGVALHEEIAARALASRASVVAGIGEFVAALQKLAPGDPRVIVAPDAEALWPLLAPRLAPDAIVLLKGSRGTRLERLVPFLRAFAGVPEPDSAPANAH
ncbi:MAG TPA: UDP-N-acetylmuramoyl-tripeptide--D-alanyl-D-alanine ligase [Gemmatimonadaceae bacterium]|nr:UDP-N-acetylmuramoyl-tripeptide--D-alanyl-D-alanine ligase [Gemmatimonadaceae bacterium]